MNYFIKGALLLALVLGAYVLFYNDSEVDSIENVSLPVIEKKAEHPSLADDEVSIVYEKKTKQIKTKSTKPVKYIQPTKSDASIYVSTKDKEGKYEISVISPSGENIHTDTAFKLLEGKIDGASFTLRIPEHLLKSAEKSMPELKIVNLETGAVQTTPMYFLDQLDNKKVHHKIDLSSDDISNYDYYEKKGYTLPGSDELH